MRKQGGLADALLSHDGSTLLVQQTLQNDTGFSLPPDEQRRLHKGSIIDKRVREAIGIHSSAVDTLKSASRAILRIGP